MDKFQKKIYYSDWIFWPKDAHSSAVFNFYFLRKEITKNTINTKKNAAGIHEIKFLDLNHFSNMLSW